MILTFDQEGSEPRGWSEQVVDIQFLQCVCTKTSGYLCTCHKAHICSELPPSVTAWSVIPEIPKATCLLATLTFFSEHSTRALYLQVYRMGGAAPSLENIVGNVLIADRCWFSKHLSARARENTRGRGGTTDKLPQLKGQRCRNEKILLVTQPRFSWRRMLDSSKRLRKRKSKKSMVSAHTKKNKSV